MLENNSASSTSLKLWGYLQDHFWQITKGSALVGAGITSYLALNRWIYGEQAMTEGLLMPIDDTSVALLQPIPYDSLQLAQPRAELLDLRYRPVARRIQEQLFVNYPVGNKFQVNTYTTANQQSPAVCTLVNGNFVIVWQSYGQDGSGDGIYAQRYAADGTPLGNEFRVNTSINGNQRNPAIGRLANGGFAITFEHDSADGSGNGVLMRRYNAAGVEASPSDYLVNAYTTGNQQKSALASSLTSGDFLVVFESEGQDGSGYGIYARRFQSSTGGTYGAPFLINSNTAGDQQNPAIISLSNGEFVITWQSSGQDGEGYGIYARRFSATAVAQGSEFQVNTFTANDQQFPAIANLNGGGFVIAWQSSSQDGDAEGIYAKRYDATGVAQGAEFRVNTATLGAQAHPAVIGLGDGDFVITWESQDSNGSGIYAQRFDANGLPKGGEFRVNPSMADNQQFPIITVLQDDRFVIGWQSNSQDGDQLGIYAQRFDSALYQTPTLNQQPLSIQQGETLLLNDSWLNATDSVVANTTLLFEVSEVEYCQFELVAQPGIAISNFTQQALMAEEIQLVHDGSIQAPSYHISVSNGYLSTAPQTATIYFSLALYSSPPIANSPTLPTELSNDVPSTQFSGPALPTEFSSGVPSIEFSSPALPTELSSDVPSTEFSSPALPTEFSSGVPSTEFSSSALPTELSSGVPSTEFSSSALPTELSSGVPSTEFSGPALPTELSSGVPSTEFSSSLFPSELSGIESSTAPVQSSSTPPWLVNIQFSIKQGQTLVLNSSHFQVSYGETLPDALIYTVSQVQYGRFERLSEPGKAITQFTQQQIENGEIQFVHDGSHQRPSFTTVVSNGLDQSPAQNSEVAFTLNIASNKGAIIGGVVGGVGGCIVLSGCGVVLAGIGLYAVKSRKSDEKQPDLEKGIEMAEAHSPTF